MLRRLIDRQFIKRPRLRRLITRALYGSALKTVDLLGASLVINTELENGYLRAFQRTRMTSLFRDEASVLINLSSLIDDNCSFVDAGANIGIYSSVFSRLTFLKRNLSIFAFEADPITFERLSENAKLHGFHAENVALTAQAGYNDFIRGAVSHVTTQIAHANAYSIAGETFLARCEPLSSFAIPGSSIVMKIDVEGAEYEVLLGAKSYFEQGRVKAVYFDGIEKLRETVDFLSKYNFRFCDGKTLRPLGTRVFSLLAVRN